MLTSLKSISIKVIWFVSKSVLVVAEDIQFAPINKGRNNNNGAGNDNTTNQPAPKYASADNTDFEEIVDDDDDDLPF